METSDSRSNVGNETNKRESRLTAKALQYKVERLQEERKAKVKRIKSTIREITELKKNVDNVEKIWSCLGNVSSLYTEACQLHDMMISILPSEEQEEQNKWFDSVDELKSTFVKETNKWLLEVSSVSNVTKIPTEGAVGAFCARSVDSPVFKGNASAMNYEKIAAEEIGPSDSVSNLSCKSKKHSTVVSKSIVSTTSSARLRAEAETAALIARQKLLKEKHALEAQQEQLRRKMEEQQELLRRKKEELDLDMELAAYMAKVSVLKASEGSHVSAKSDERKSYLKKGRTLQLNADAATFMPAFSTQLLQTEDGERAHSSGYAAVKPKVSHKAEPHTAVTGAGLPTVTDGAKCQASLHFQSNPSEPAIEDTSDHRLFTVLEKQNEITSILVEQQSLFLLPKRELHAFDGDPLQYQTFIKAFEHNIEARTQSQKDCLYYLEQYTRGQPRDLVRSCQHLPPAYGYIQAKCLLQEHFGDPFKVASAYMEKVLLWPVLKGEDVKALQAYSLLLRECCNSMGDCVGDLNVPTNMQTIVKKLPYKLRDRWRSVACELQEKFNRRATFHDIVNFVEKQVKIASDPLFGDIQDSAGTGRKEFKPVKSRSGPKPKGSSFATTVAPAERRVEPVNKSEKDLPAKVCSFCGAGHVLDVCLLLDKKTQNEKMSFLKENKLCFGCLCIGHRSRDCRKRLTCRVCHLKHPTLLHVHSKTSQGGSVQISEGSEGARETAVVSVQSSGLTGAGKQEGTLSILPVQVKSKKGHETLVTYAFLDPGSTASFCTERLMNQLNLTGRKLDILLRTMGQEKVVDSYMLADLEVAGLDSDNFCDLPEIFTQRSMPVHRGNIPQTKDLRRWPHLRHINIQEIEAEVDLLIGTNVPQALEPWEVVHAVDGGPYAIKTILGWTVNGPLRGDCQVSEDHLQPNVTVNRISVARLDELWEKQLKVDFPETQKDEQLGLSKEDERFMESVSESVKLVDGHYSIGLPVRQRYLNMPNNKSVAEQRALSLKKRLTKNLSFRSDYVTCMSGMIINGYAEAVPPEQLARHDGRVWYIPHHGVYHPQKKKLRVVFDCGATFKGTSLNSQLLQGPDLTSSLVGVLTRFRKEPVVLMADIEAMFHQVKVPVEDSDLLRFLWWPDGDCSKELVEYRMVAHLFGASSSPSCACFALRKCAQDNREHFSPVAVNTVLHHFYVDDCLVSVASEKEAVSLSQELTALCAKGGFKLTKWISNRRTVLAAIRQEDRAKEVKDLDLDSDALPVERALGVQWCVQSDSFKFKITLKNRPLTKRGILSVISSVYDPLGFLAPIILTAKKFIQDLCRRRLGWDDPLPSSVVRDWMAWLEDLHLLEQWEVSRCLKPVDFRDLASAQLHHFADASEDGCGTVTYLLLHNINDRAHCAFVMGKARVAPLKPVTIPRMELTAAVLASRMDRIWKKELQMELKESVFWTDSTSVLKYIKNETSRFKIFIANRVSEILQGSNVSQWRYVNTLNNPADLASRGAKVESFLKTSAWLCGPEFLLEPESKWPINPEAVAEPLVGDPEVKALVVSTVQVEQSSPVEKLISHFSSWLSLKRAVGWLLKFKNFLLSMKQHRQQLRETLTKSEMGAEQLEKNLPVQMQKVKVQVSRDLLSVEDIVAAEKAIIRFCQRTKYSEEFACLERGECVKRTSHLFKLNPILEDGLIRVGGRLGRAAMPVEAKHPVILAKDLHISGLILRHIHQETGHSGRNHMLSQLRQRYWIPAACAAIRRILAKCVICRRLSAKPGHQKMADLPLSRITPDEPPFSRVGLDCFGPYEVKRGRAVVKKYGLIFTCLAIRAIHLEVLSSLDTDSFINGLRRFIARRGQVLEIRSDNGTNFVGAERELREALEKLNHNLINGMLLQKGVKWVFNTPAASHHGGAWERLVRSVRKVLNSILKTQILDEESLVTVFCEAEAIVNSRPITKASTDPNDLEALTPNHLLLLKSQPSLPPGLFEKADVYGRRRWKQVQYMSDLFWKRWLKEYLPSLQERQKWNRVGRNFIPGDIVMLMDNMAPRSSWITARVLDTIPDKNGLVRTVRIKTKTSVLDRPITKVCLLQEAEEQ